MCAGALVLRLALLLGGLHLRPAKSEVTYTAVLGQPVTLPCFYSSWSPSSNSMCWGRGQCPKSKCSQELIHTDGSSVTSRMSAKYNLRGNIQRGDISLTISTTGEGDSGVYCCRIEVPGWFNDVKRNIHLVLRRAPTTTTQTTTRPTTTPYMTTTTAVLPTTVVTTPELTTGAPLHTGTALQTRAASAFTAVATTCPLTTLSYDQETTKILLTSEPPTEGPILTEESETFLPSSDSHRSTGVTSVASPLLTFKGTEVLFRSSASQATTVKTTSKMTFPIPNAIKSKEEDSFYLLMTVPSVLGFVLLALLGVFLWQGKVRKTRCFQKPKSLDGECSNVFSDTRRAREDEESLFTL